MVAATGRRARHPRKKYRSSVFMEIAYRGLGATSLAPADGGRPWSPWGTPEGVEVPDRGRRPRGAERVLATFEDDTALYPPRIPGALVERGPLPHLARGRARRVRSHGARKARPARNGKGDSRQEDRDRRGAHRRDRKDDAHTRH